MPLDGPLSNGSVSGSYNVPQFEGSDLQILTDLHTASNLVPERLLRARKIRWGGLTSSLRAGRIRERALPEIEREAHALAHWISARLPGLRTVNARVLRRARAIPTDQAPRYDAAIGELVEAGWLRQPPSSGNGRPRKDYLINRKLIAPG